MIMDKYIQRILHRDQIYVLNGINSISIKILLLQNYRYIVPIFFEAVQINIPFIDNFYGNFCRPTQEAS